MNSILTFLALLLSAFIILLVPSLVSTYVPVYGAFTITDASKAVLLCGALAVVTG